MYLTYNNYNNFLKLFRSAGIKKRTAFWRFFHPYFGRFYFTTVKRSVWLPFSV